MASEKEINEKIMTITMKIQKDYPELSKYLNELPVTIPIESDPEINTRVLTDYYESLVKLLSTYELEMAQKASKEK